MTLGDIVLPIVLAGVLVYSGRNMVLGLRSGRMSLPGGTLHDRARRPGQFWTAFVFEVGIFLVLAVMLVRQLAWVYS